MSSELTESDKIILEKNRIDIDDPRLELHLGLLAEQFKIEEERKKNRSIEDMLAESNISGKKYKRIKRKRNKKQSIKHIPIFSSKKQRIKTMDEKRKKAREKLIQESRSKNIIKPSKSTIKRSENITNIFDKMKIKGGVCKGCGKVKLHYNT